MGIVSEPRGIADVQAGPPRPRHAQRQFHRPAPAARRPRGEGRGRPLLFLLRRALSARLPDLDRHSPVHPPDRRRQPARRRRDDLRRQHHGRHVRARLPDRDVVRGGLRARGGRGQAGADRPAAALRRRRADGDRQDALQPRRADRQARRDRRRRPGGPGLRPRARRRRPSRRRSSRARRSRAASTNTASPPTRRPTTSPRARSTSSCRSAASR